MSYGGYGGELQNYDPQRYAAAPPTQPTWTEPPPAVWNPNATAPPAPLVAAAEVPRERPPQRPAVIGLAATLGATASLQWICALSFVWLVATTGANQLGTSGVDGGLFHILNRFNYRMLDGLAWPLYLFPLASLVLSFLLLARRPWARLAYTITGAAALVWSAWWLRNDFVWWLVPAGYIAVAVVVLWTADASRWYRWGRASDQARSDPAGQPF